MKSLGVETSKKMAEGVDKELSIQGERLPFREIKDSDEMIDVKMNSYGVTSATRANPVLKTIGIGPCIAVILHEPDSKVTGLLHMSFPQGRSIVVSAQKDIVNMLVAMQRNGVDVKARGKMLAHIIGGRSDYFLDEVLVTIVRERLKQLGISNILTDLRSGIEGHCIAIDARNGEVFKLINILPKKMDISDEIRAMNINSEGVQSTSDDRTLK